MDVSSAEAKAKFSELLKRAEAGEEISLTRHGKVVAKLVGPDEDCGARRLLGAMRGRIRLSDDFHMTHAAPESAIR